MKLFKELTVTQQTKILDKHDIGPLFYVQRGTLKEMLLASEIHYFEVPSLQMHINYKD